MTTELATTTRTLSTQLTNLFTEINNTFGRGKELIMKAYNLALQEGYTPYEAKDLVVQNVTAFGKTTIYSALPQECKTVTRPKKIPKLKSSEHEFNSEGMGVAVLESESTSTSQTGPDGKEVEVEQEYTPPGPELESQPIDLETHRPISEEIQEKDKMIKELREEVLTLKKCPPHITPSDVANVVHVQDKRIRELEEIIKSKPPEFTKASNLPRQTHRFILKFNDENERIAMFLAVKKVEIPKGGIEFSPDDNGLMKTFKVWQYDTEAQQKENT